MVSGSSSGVIGDRSCGGVMWGSGDGVRDGRGYCCGVRMGAGGDWVRVGGMTGGGSNGVCNHGTVRKGRRIGWSCRGYITNSMYSLSSGCVVSGNGRCGSGIIGVSGICRGVGCGVTRDNVNRVRCTGVG